jgi:hypothetical protein
MSATTTALGISQPTNGTQLDVADADPLSLNHCPCETHTGSVEAHSFAADGRMEDDTQPMLASAANTSASDQDSVGFQHPNVAGNSSAVPGQRAADAQEKSACTADSFVEEGQNRVETKKVSGTLHDALLLVHAEALDDLESARLAMENRVRAMRQVHGLEGTPEEQRLDGLVEALRKLEHQAVLDLQKVVKKHPLGDWIIKTQGIGLKQGGRLLATIGDPGARPNVAKLWAYCGYSVRDGQAPKRRKGERSNWNMKARSQAYLIAESCMKNRRSPYRAIYDYGREKYADCQITDLHKHKRALRLVAKAILRDLWIEARRLAAESQPLIESQRPDVPAATSLGTDQQQCGIQ